MKTVDLATGEAHAAARLIGAGSAVIAGSAFADSMVEHYRGSFANPVMVLPLAASGISVAVNGMRATGSTQGQPIARFSHAASTAVGTAGLAFHVYNILKQPGGMRLNNLFYQAPIGAPASLVLAGSLGALADSIATGAGVASAIGISTGRLIAGYTALGIMGTVGEAGLLHYRGAFHNPAMWLPIALPPLSAAALLRAALTGRVTAITTALLAATAALGLIGSAFHAYGVRRNMGGWRNWRQNVLAGPPLPAPPSFTGLAAIGLAAVLLIRRAARG